MSATPAATPLRAAIYCRVSGKKQEFDGTSLDTQEAECRKKAIAEGWSLVMEPIRESHTGFELWQRKKLERIRELIRRREIDVLLCYDPDRLAREQAHVGILYEEPERNGVAIKYVTVDFDNSPLGKFIRNALAFAAELEREKIRARTWRAITAQAENGRRLAGCKARYGYQWAPITFVDGTTRERGRLVADEEGGTAAIVRRIFAMARSGVSTRKIATRLTTEGIPTPKGRATWTHTSVRLILTDQIYTGRAVVFDRTTEKVMGEKRDGTYGQITRIRLRTDDDEGPKRIELPEGTVEALIDPTDFAPVRARLERSKAEAFRNTKPENREDALLRAGFARCGYCKGTLVVSRSPGITRYRCPNTDAAGERCPSFTISTRVLDPMVWKRVTVALTEEDDIVAKAEAQLLGSDVDVELEGIEAALERIRRERSFALRQIDNIARVTTDPTEADEAAAPYNAKLIDLARAERQTRDELAARREIRSKRHETEQWLRDFRAQLGKAATLTEALDYQGKRNLFDLLGLKVFVYRTDHEPRIEMTANIDLGKWAWLDDMPPIYDVKTDSIDLSYLERLPKPTNPSTVDTRRCFSTRA